MSSTISPRLVTPPSTTSQLLRFYPKTPQCRGKPTGFLSLLAASPRDLNGYLQGYGSSPALYDDLVIVSVDNKSGGLIAGLDRATGEFVWKKPRPKLPNYPSPAILRAAGRDQVVMIGCELVSSFDPPTGETLWEVPGSSTETMTTSVTNGELVYSSGGFPNNHIAAIRADGSGELVWENTIRVAVPSMVTQGNHLFAVTDRGIAICFDSSTGDQIWKHRLGGTFSASPVLVGDQIYATNESG